MRRGVSLLEVLFAILVVSVGLLGALAVFPVANAMARKGKVADMTGIAGRSAVHDFKVRGMHEPRRWMAWNTTTSTYAPYAPVFGEAYCIDPRGIAANPTAQVAISAFPYSAAVGQPMMRRLTLDRMTVNAAGQLMPSGLPMTTQQAAAIFLLGEDASFDRPDDRSLPAAGAFVHVDHDNNIATAPLPMARQSEGHLSWMATLVPKPELYASAAVVQNTEYVLSVVVFEDRPADMAAGDPMHERVVGADFADAGGLGFAGGEVYLTWTAPQTTANDTFAKDVQLKLRTGDWIAISGFLNHNLGGTISVFQWYRVAECDSAPEYHASEGHYAIAASLVGRDVPLYDSLPPNGPILLAPQAVIMTGVRGVYEKTIKLSAGG